MKFGVCGNLSRLPVIKAAGYDYIEMNFSTLALMSEEDFVKTREALAEAGMRAEAFNGFFKADVVLYSEGADLDTIAAYCETGFSRAAQLGGSVAVLGSGGARSIPEGMTREEAMAIRWHMGFSGTEDARTVGQAFQKYPLAFALATADSEASYFLENEDRM